MKQTKRASRIRGLRGGRNTIYEEVQKEHQGRGIMDWIGLKMQNATIDIYVYMCIVCRMKDRS